MVRNFNNEWKFKTRRLYDLVKPALKLCRYPVFVLKCSWKMKIERARAAHRREKEMLHRAEWSDTNTKKKMKKKHTKWTTWKLHQLWLVNAACRCSLFVCACCCWRIRIFCILLHLPWFEDELKTTITS